MRNFFENLRYKRDAFMQGRYGYDRMSRHMIVAAFILVIVSFFVNVRFLSIITLVLIFIPILRALSKNIWKREREAAFYDKILSKPRRFIDGIRRQKNDVSHKYFRCRCGQNLRVPRGRGKIEITCPRCGRKLIRRT